LPPRYGGVAFRQPKPEPRSPLRGRLFLRRSKKQQPPAPLKKVVKEEPKAGDEYRRVQMELRHPNDPADTPGLSQALRVSFNIPPAAMKGFGEAWSASDYDMVIDLEDDNDSTLTSSTSPTR
jgi:hypothetical protein